MSALGHSRPSHFVPVLNNVRYASDSDHSRYESELTLWAKLRRCAPTVGQTFRVVFRHRSCQRDMPTSRRELKGSGCAPGRRAIRR